MKTFNVDKVERIQMTLDTTKGLVETLNDLLQDHVTLFTQYPGENKGKCFQADCLYSKLFSLSQATTSILNQAQTQLNGIISDYYKQQ